MSATKIAKTPESGPKPKALTKINAHITISIPRIKSKKLLTFNVERD